MHFSLFERLFWLVLAAIALGISITHEISGNFAGVAIAALVLFIFCVRVFIGHGGEVVTPLGVWSLMTALVGSYAGLVGWNDARVSSNSVLLAISLILFQTVGIAIIAWGSADYKVLEFGSWRIVRTRVVALCWTLLLVSVFLQELSRFGRIISEGTAFSAIVVLSFALWSSEKVRLISWSTVSVGIAFTFYVVFLHSGSGRLRIAALAFAIMIVMTLRFRTRFIKWSTVAMIPVGLSFFAWYRINFIENNFGSAEGRSGLESLTDPIITFSFFIDMETRGSFIFQGYKNFLTPIAFLLPKSWNVPPAFGYEIVGVWRPESYGSGYSAAATAAGEWFWMGGIPAVFLSVFFLGFALRLLTSIFQKVTNGFGNSGVQTATILVVILLGCSLGDLVWGGIHTFIYRSVVRIVTVVCIIAIISLLQTLLSQTSRSIVSTPNIKYSLKMGRGH